MQFSKFALIAALAAPAFAQTPDLALLGELPACALVPATTALGSTSCAATDIKCVCSDSAFVTGLTATVQKACTADEIAKTLEVATKLCASAGVTLTVPGAGSSAPVVPSSSAPVYGAPVTTAPVYVPTTPAASVTIVPTKNGTLTTPTITSAPTASFTGAANAVRGSFAAGVLGAAGALLFL